LTVLILRPASYTVYFLYLCGKEKVSPEVSKLGKPAIAPFEKALEAVVPDENLRWAFTKLIHTYY
jgi:hypothetical protein